MSTGTLTVIGSVLNTSGVTVDAPGVLELSNASGSALAATTHVANNGALRVSSSSQEAGVIDGLGTTDVTGGPDNVSQVPEPGTWLLLAAGAVCLLPLLRRQRRAA